MKAEELMIGDWVIVYEKAMPVKARVDGVYGNNAFVLGHPRTVKNGFVEPIRLTPEILEKSGFSEQRAERMSVWSFFGFSIELDFSTWKYYWANGDVEISSVHELQHALRLCGIEKEIVL